VVYTPFFFPVNFHRKNINHLLQPVLAYAGNFFPKGGPAKFNVGGLGQAGVEIEIQDFGQGIKPEFQENVFEKFYQIDMSMTRESVGLGLGLYIARTLARIYGGDVTLTSQPGSGTTILFTIHDMAADWA
jgi:signal transduction histidine kinase